MFLKVLRNFIIVSDKCLIELFNTCKKQRNIVSTAMLYTEKKVEAMAYEPRMMMAIGTNW